MSCNVMLCQSIADVNNVPSPPIECMSYYLKFCLMQAVETGEARCPGNITDAGGQYSLHRHGSFGPCVVSLECNRLLAEGELTPATESIETAKNFSRT